MLGLLDNPEYWQDGYAALRDIKALETRLDPDFVPDFAIEIFVQRILRPFFEKWNALPPTFELLGFDPEYRMGLTVLSGQWGLIPVFPWSTDRDIRASVRKMRKAVGKAHEDSENTRRAVLAQWLELHDFSRKEIAHAVWGRTSGLRRPSKTEAFRRLSEEQEVKLIQKFMDQGLSYPEAEKKLFRTARGSEPRATATVRMAEARFRKQHETLRQALVSPKECEPFSYAVTMLLRSAFLDRDDREAGRWVGALRDALGVTPVLKQ